MSKEYKAIPLSFNRKMIRAAVTVTKRKNTIHSLTEVDISVPREKMRTHFEKTGEKLSLTAYVVTCLANVIRQHPQLNSFIRGNKLILLDDVCVSVLVERAFDDEKVPEPAGIKKAHEKTFQQIQDEIRAAQHRSDKKLGSLSKQTWIRFIPGFLLKAFVRLADKNLKLAKIYGKVGVTAVGMYSKEPFWFIPHGTATVLVTVGSIQHKVIEIDGHFVSREHLSLTVSFDHNIVDGAPAARFMSAFIRTIKAGNFIP